MKIEGEQNSTISLVTNKELSKLVHRLWEADETTERRMPVKNQFVEDFFESEIVQVYWEDCWDFKSDKFKCKWNSSPVPEVITMRYVTSQEARFYDPDGLFTMRAKLYI